MEAPPIFRMAADLARALGATDPPLSSMSGLALFGANDIFVWGRDGEKLAWRIVPDGLHTARRGRFI